uniref:THAP4-like heme-binding domain-containing protein n=1 Tax=Zonotrichia albicollis TaxID=44394 RepID=A0A8D2MD64_ZONAL
MSINEVIMSASGACKLIDSLHSYCFSSRQSKSQVCCLREQVEKKNGELKLLRQRISRSDSQVRKLKEKLNEMKRNTFPYLNSLISQDCETPQLNPVMEPLSWMLGTWLSDPPGDGTFPTMKPFQYLEEVHISHVGQPMLNFSFNAFHPDTRKPMHRECGFIRLKPDTNKVAFISAQNTGTLLIPTLGKSRGSYPAGPFHHFFRQFLHLSQFYFIKFFCRNRCFLVLDPQWFLN